MSQVSEVAQIKQGLASEVSEVAQIKQDLVSQVSEVAQIKQDLASQVSEVAQIKQGLMSQVSELNQLKQDLASRVSEVAQIKQGLVSEVAQIKQGLVSEVAQIKQDLAPQVSEVAQIKQGLVSQVSELAQLNQDVHAFKDEFRADVYRLDRQFERRVRLRRADVGRLKEEFVRALRQIKKCFNDDLQQRLQCFETKFSEVNKIPQQPPVSQVSEQSVHMMQTSFGALGRSITQNQLIVEKHHYRLQYLEQVSEGLGYSEYQRTQYIDNAARKEGRV